MCWPRCVPATLLKPEPTNKQPLPLLVAAHLKRVVHHTGYWIRRNPFALMHQKSERLSAIADSLLDHLQTGQDDTSILSLLAQVSAMLNTENPNPCRMEETP